MNKFIKLILDASHMHPAAFREFTTAMSGREFGEEETYDAWLWFARGWCASRGDSYESTDTSEANTVAAAGGR